MGWFTKKSDGDKPKVDYEKSGTPGKPGHGYGKGSVISNPDKYVARTEAQRKRQDRLADKS